VVQGPSLAAHQTTEQHAKRFSDNFVTKITKIREKMDSEPLEQVQHDTPDPLLQTFKPATQDEIRHIVKESSNASCNLDPWPTAIMKDNPDCVLPVLTDIVNKITIRRSDAQFTEGSYTETTSEETWFG
jgi:hypothetical protein